MTATDGEGDPSPPGDDGPASVADLRARVDVLAAENRRLREEYERARRTTRRRTAAGLAATGAVAAAGAVAFPESRTVLFALAGTGLFAAALVAGLASARSVPADAAAAVYDARARLGSALVADLGLSARRVYVPTGAPEGEHPVRLFVPQHRDHAVPALDPDAPLVVATGDDREAGVALAPTGAGLYREFRSWSRRDLAPDAGTLADAVADALGDGFGLVESVRVDVAAGADAAGGRAMFGVAGAAFGAVDRFDHPVASFAGVALAAGLSVPVAVSVGATDDDRADFLVTCRWPAGE